MRSRSRLITATRGDTLAKHKLPYHPLKAHGYSSVGDAHSSAPVTKSQGGSELDERSTRFGGRAQECGLHVETPFEPTKKKKA